MAEGLQVVRASNGAPLDVVAATELAGMGSGTAFSPGAPMAPFSGYGTTPRVHDFPTGYNIAARPRRNERVAFDTLKGIIEAYDVAQMCIWHRINSIRSLKWTLVAAPGVEGEDITRWVDVGMAALAKPDRRRRFKPWLTKYLYDVLAYDAGALFRMRNNAGRAIGLKIVDGTTIGPLLDEFGDRPVRERDGDPAPPAYVQYAQGLPWTWLTDDDLIYEPYQETSSSPYGKAPIETVLLNANTDLRFQAHFIQRFTEGNVPEAFASSPEGWSPEQIESFQEAWDAFMLGDEAAKHQIKWVPHGTSFAWSNEHDFDDKFSLFLMRKTAASYHVTPQDLGFTEDVNRATSETQVDNQFRVGDLPLIEHIQGILDGFLQDDLVLPLSFKFDTGQEKEDRLATAQADDIYIKAGVTSASEVRERVYGLGEPDGRPVPRFIYSARAGAIPLSALYAVAGPVDPLNAAPVPGAPLPHKPFAPVEGVAPQKLPDSPPLAVVQYPADNPQAADAAVQQQVDAATPVPIVAGHADASVTKARGDEIAAYRRFVAARRKAGKWRPFEFGTVDAVTAHRLNDAGRAEVRKADGLLIAAGLAVLAADTGRVLMLQRAFDPSDGAAGLWEFPGGHIEDGESPLDAAVREWCEETGCLLPDGEQCGGWASTDGVYRGFVWLVDAEASVSLLERGAVSNPDDPDGDLVEAIAWWDPALLPGNPAVRSELGRDVVAVVRALVQAGTPVGGPSSLTVAEARTVADARAAAVEGGYTAEQFAANVMAALDDGAVVKADPKG